MLCAAYTLKRVECTKGIKNANSVVVPDRPGYQRVFHLCGGTGHTSADASRLIAEHRLNMERSTVWQIIHNPVDEDTQGVLPLENKEGVVATTTTLSVRRVVRADDTHLYVLPKQTTWSGTLEEFKALCCELLAKVENRNLVGFAAREGNEVLFVTRTEAKRTSRMIRPVQVANREQGSTKVTQPPREQKPRACANCSHWENGKYIQVQHMTDEEFKDCSAKFFAEAAARKAAKEAQNK